MKIPSITTTLLTAVLSLPSAGCTKSAKEVAKQAAQQTTQQVNQQAIIEKAISADKMTVNDAIQKLFAFCSIGHNFKTAEGVEGFTNCVIQNRTRTMPKCLYYPPDSPGTISNTAPCGMDYLKKTDSEIEDYVLSRANAK